MNLEGNIGEIDLIDRLVELWREQFTGAIRFENDGIIKILYFKGGDVLSASTNDRADSIDEILMRAGKVSRDHVKQALAKRKENETLGDALLTLGFITRKELTWARRVQVIGVIRSIAAWSAGSFTIVADYLPKRDEGTLFPLPQILVELTVTDQDRSRFETAMAGGDVVLEKSELFASVFPTLGLNEDADAIADAIDGARSAREVANVSGRDTFNVYKLLHALSLLGVVRPATGGAQVTPEVLPEPDFLMDFGAASAEPTQEWSDFSATSNPDFELGSDSSISTSELGPADDDVTLNLPAELPPAGDAAPKISWDAAPAWEIPEVDDAHADLSIGESAPVMAEAPQQQAKTVAWDAPARDPIAVPIQVPIEPAADADEEQWGFDEAQLETSRRAVAADTPALAPKRKQGGRYGMLIAIIGILILAGAGYGGFLWWSGREQAPVASAEPAVRPSVKPPVTRTAPAVATLTDATATAMTTAAPAPEAVPTATATATQPAPVAAAPTPEPVTALPVAAPAAAAQTAQRRQLDELARQYASNPTGNYTIQIQILCDPGNLATAMKSGGSNLWFVPQPIGARSCYRVFWGRFNTDREASAAMSAIPRALRDPNAAVKPVPRG